MNDAELIKDKLEDIERKLDWLLHEHYRNPDGTYIFTEEELVRSEQPTMAHQVPVTFKGTKVGEAALQQVEDGVLASMSFGFAPHTTAPAPGAVVFGPDMREITQPWEGTSDPRYPLMSTCSCGRQIAMIASGTVWAYCGA